MADSAAAEIIAVPETVYGTTPDLATVGAGTVRFISETLSGTPTTTESQELRRDRNAAGLVVVGVEVGGDINEELSKDPMTEAFFAGALMNEWTSGATGTTGAVTIVKGIAPNDQTATITLTDDDTGDVGGTGRALAVGDIVMLTGFATAANNVPVQVTEVVDANTFSAVVPRSMESEDADSAAIIVGDYVDIGTMVKSWTLSKAYTDVTHLATEDIHSQRYTGSIVNTMELAFTYGEIASVTFGFLSNGYEQEAPSLHQQIDDAGGTVEPASTTQPMNASVDLNLVTVDGLPTEFCIQSLTISLTNNATPQNCIGHIAPMKYNLGTANISISATIYLGDQSYDKFMPGKLDMTPISIAVACENADGGYAFTLAAVQLSFPDPAATGGNNPIMIEAAGTAKIGDGGESSLRIWRYDNEV